MSWVANSYRNLHKGDNMSQSKLGSLAEAVVNTAIGLLVAMFATAGICKLYGIPMSWENNFIITFWMTVLSVLRSYLLRRLFNFNWLRFKTNWRIWWIVCLTLRW